MIRGLTSLRPVNCTRQKDIIVYPVVFTLLMCSGVIINVFQGTSFMSVRDGFSVYVTTIIYNQTVAPQEEAYNLLNYR